MIIFINGSINSGKSTVAKELAEKLGNAAVVEIDALREFIPWMPLEKAIPLNLENAVSVIRNFAKEGMSVIVPYPLSRKNYDYFCVNLPEYKDCIQVYTLSLKIESALADRGSRTLTDLERERITYHYSIGIPSPDFGRIIDTNNKSIKEVVEMVLGFVSE